MTMSFQRVLPRRTISSSRFILIGFVSLCILVSVWSNYWRLHQEELHIWFFDIGQGDAIFLETPHGQQILVDGGPDQAVLSKLASVMLPWDRSIDAVFISHPDADHISGLVFVLKQYDVQSVYETGVRGGTPVIVDLVKQLEHEHTQQIQVQQGQTFVFDGVTIDILWPTTQVVQEATERNNTSIVMRVRYGQTVLLLTGDAEAEAERQFVDQVGDIDVLKLGHHGSKTSSSREFLRATDPEIAIISAGVDNPYGHPHPIILSRLVEMDSKIFRTDEDGDIVMISDGKTMEVKPAFLPF